MELQNKREKLPFSVTPPTPHPILIGFMLGNYWGVNMYKCGVFSGWLILIKAPGQNTAGEEFGFSFRTVYSSHWIQDCTRRFGDFTVCCSCSPHPHPLHFHSPANELCSLCIPLPTSVVDTGHLRWAWSREQLDSKSSVFNEGEIILQKWLPLHGLHASKQLQYQYDLIHCFPWAVYRCLISPPCTGLNPVRFHCIVLFSHLCALNVPPGFYFQAELLCTLGFTMDSNGHTQTHPSFCMLTFFCHKCFI